MMLIIKYNGVDEIVITDKQLDLETTLLYNKFVGYRLADVLLLPDEDFFIKT
jgi:hypothetical protein